MVKHIRAARPGSALIANRGEWSWSDHAACQAEDVDVFFDGDDTQARDICMTCPTTVRETCLDYAISRPEKYGVWGGFTPDEREAERRNRLRGRRPRYSPPSLSKVLETPKSTTPEESAHLVAEMFDAGYTARQITEASGVSLRALTRLRKDVLPETVFRSTEDKLRAAHQVLVGSRSKEAA